MKFLIQIFKSAGHIEKPDYNTQARNEVGDFKDFISSTGFLSGNTIILPEKLNSLVSNQHNLIIIQDAKDYQNAGKQPPMHETFHQGQNQCSFELFDFRVIDDLNLEVSFKYNEVIGLPKRDNHKIALLSEGESIRFSINGMHDFTLTGRKQRTFSEFDYIIQFVGMAKTIDFIDNTGIQILKTIPEKYKVINERKLLK